MEKKLDGNYTRMLQALLNKPRKQRPTKQQQYGHLPLITKTIKVRQTRCTGHCWRSRDELISDVLQWTTSHGWAKAGWPARPYIRQLCANIICSPKDLPNAKEDREGWRERVRNIHADSSTWGKISVLFMFHQVFNHVACLPYHSENGFNNPI